MDDAKVGWRVWREIDDDSFRPMHSNQVEMSPFSAVEVFEKDNPVAVCELA